MYKLTIIKYEDNENYERDLARYKEEISLSSIYTHRFNEPPVLRPEQKLATRSLEVVLTDDEYRMIKNGVMGIFE